MDMTGNRQKTKSPKASAPNFSQLLSDVKTALGETLILECRVDGYPRPEIHWEKDGKLLGKSRNIHTTRCGESCTLELRSVREADLGVYHCVALNIFGSARTQSHILLPGSLPKAEVPEKTPRTLRVPGTSSFRSRSADRTVARSIVRSPSCRRREEVKDEGLQPLRGRHTMENSTSNRQPNRDQNSIQSPWEGNKSTTTTTTEGRSRTRSFVEKVRVPSIQIPGIFRSGHKRQQNATLLQDATKKVSTSELELSKDHNRNSKQSVFRNRAFTLKEHKSPKLEKRHTCDQKPEKNTNFKSNLSTFAQGPVKFFREIGQKVSKQVPHRKTSITKPNSSLSTATIDLNSQIKVNGGINYLSDITPEISKSDIVENWKKDAECNDSTTLNGVIDETPVRTCTSTWVNKHLANNSEPKIPDSISHDFKEISQTFEKLTIEPKFDFKEADVAEELPEPTVEEACQFKSGSWNDQDKKIINYQKYVDEYTNTQPLPEITIQNTENDEEPDNFIKTCTCNCHGVERPPPKFNEADSGNIRISSMPEDSYEEFPSKQSPPPVKNSSENDDLTKSEDGLQRAVQLAPFSTPSKIVKGPISVTVRSGERVTLSISFIGTPPNKVTWMRGGTTLMPGDQYSISTCDFESEVTIHSVTADDSGKYIATVENDYGGDSCFASVAVLGFPKPPGGPPTASDFTAHSLVLSWYGSMFDGGSVLTGYVVEMCRVPDRQWETVATCIDTSCVVDGLSLGERYLFRVRAKNRYGQGEPSRETQTICLDEYLSQQGDENDDLPNNLLAMQPFSEFMERYDLKEEVGRGKFGKVHRCIEKWSGLPRAAKMIRCRKSRDKSDVYREIDVMKKLRHPKLLRIVGAFESEKMMVMVTEFISGGELFQRVIMDDFVLTESDCILFMRQICDAVSYMHRCSILHLDLKPENILCKTKTSHQIKIIDFGLSTLYNPNESLCILFGTPEFVAPEVIAFEPVGPPSDMWSVGVICYVLLSGLSPFLGDSERETFANITRGEIDFDEEEFDSISQDAKNFISSIVVKNPRRRLTASECLNHAWLKRAYWLEDYPPLSTEKLKKFIIRRKWQKSGTAIRALRRFVTLSRSSAESFGELDGSQTPLSPALTDTSEDSGVFPNGFDFPK